MKKPTLAALVFAFSGACMSLGRALPEPSTAALPRWRGFNLLERFRFDWKQGDFREEDFRLIASLGFNFVRLPMDYRYWIKDGKWDQIDGQALGAIDQALAWGRQYGLHVSLNFHRAPGYCVNPPREARDLWTDPEAGRVCALHWRAFARRYKGIPNRELSFDLVNEPSGVDGAAYARVAALLVGAIRAEDPARLIIADGREGGGTPVPELIPLGLPQSGRGYQPFNLTHHKADWVEGAMDWPVPAWPALHLTPFLYGAEKKELQAPLRLSGAFPKGTGLRIRLEQVSGEAELVARADGRELLRRTFKPGPGKGEWKEVVYREEWKVYQNRYDLDLKAELKEASRELSLSVERGDWLRISEIGLRLPHAAGEQVIRPNSESWGLKPGRLVLRADLSLDLDNSDAHNRAWLKREVLGPWLDLRARGVGVMIGEWGVFDKTPHAATLAFMEDMLAAMKEAGLGWALWNFRGGFGPLDTSRPDAPYEDWQGHRLDRKMMDLLQKY